MRCYLCRKEYGEPEDGDGVIEPEFGVCPLCRADAALGRAVRKMPRRCDLRHLIVRAKYEWMLVDTRYVRHEGDTPEAALKAAGLMEVEK